MTNNIRHVSTVISEISHGCLHHSLLVTSQMVNKMTINTSRKRKEEKRKEKNTNMQGLGYKMEIIPMFCLGTCSGSKGSYCTVTFANMVNQCWVNDVKTYDFTMSMFSTVTGKCSLKWQPKGIFDTFNARSDFLLGLSFARLQNLSFVWANSTGVIIPKT